jgi:hypothetical protein
MAGMAMRGGEGAAGAGGGDDNDKDGSDAAAKDSLLFLQSVVSALRLCMKVRPTSQCAYPAYKYNTPLDTLHVMPYFAIKYLLDVRESYFNQNQKRPQGRCTSQGAPLLALYGWSMGPLSCAPLLLSAPKDFAIYVTRFVQ